MQKTSQEVRDEYLHHLLGNIPKDANDKFQIVEKSTVPPPTAPLNSQASVYDTIEGYRIEVKKNGKSPTTMILKKKKEEDIQKEQESKQQQQKEEEEAEAGAETEDVNPEDPDALFETMMMLKDMNMDKEDKLEAMIPKSKPVVEKTALPSQPSINESTKPASVQPIAPPKPIIESPIKQEKKPVATSPPKEKEQQNTNVINVTTTTTTTTPAKKPKKSIKKKKNVPELSLFGTIWTMLDHMTTKATRIYLNELQNNHQRVDVGHLLASENDLMDESIYLRGQIFSERILDTYVFFL